MSKRVLYVEGDAELARLLRQQLEPAGFVVDTVATGKEALESFKKFPYECILLDHALPKVDGLDVLRRLDAEKGAPPVILLAPIGHEKQAVDALQLGAEDFIIKDAGQNYIELLPHVVHSALIKLKLRKQAIQQQDRMNDQITELTTRNMAIEQELGQARKSLAALEVKMKSAEKSGSPVTREFLSHVSHEIRTPMNAIIGLTDILSKSQPLSPKQKEFISTLGTSAREMMTLINSLLDTSTIQARAVEFEKIPFSVSDTVQDVIRTLAGEASAKGLSFAVNDDNIAGRHYVGDRNRLQQIVLQLCGNALKFTETGVIKIDIQRGPSGAARTENIIITIADTGVGIPEDKIGHIFDQPPAGEISDSRKADAASIGLAATRMLAELMGGTINVKSKPGKGAAFTVTLPLAIDGAHVAAAAVPEKHVAAEDKPCILVVDDYEPNVMVITYFLENFGYTYDIASSGAEALGKIKARDFAAVLMDVQMHGMNGFEATRNIRAFEKQTGAVHRLPVIGVTAHVMSADHDRCLAAGMDDYLPKPFNPAELQEKITSCLKAANG